MRKLAKIKIIYLFSFIFSLHIALSAYVNSTFLTQFFPEDYVGLLYTAGAIIMLVLLSLSSELLEHFGNRKFILWLLAINMLGLIGLIFSNNTLIIGLSFISFITTNTLVFLCIDIFIEHFGTVEKIGKIRGLYLTILNLGWVISPLISSLLISKVGGYRTIYIVAFISIAFIATYFFFSIKTFKDKKYKRISFPKAYKYLKKNNSILSITVISFILKFFYALAVVYIPLYLYKNIGFNWSQLGIIFTVMLIPFVILEFPVGFMVDKYHISKRFILYLGFTIMGLSVLSIAFATSTNIAVWALILFMSRVGAALVESTSEIYFFTHVKEKDEYLLGVFRDMGPVATIIGPAVATLILYLSSFKGLFITLTIVIFTAFYYIPQLKKT